MSKISFKAFCVEYYASPAGVAGAEAYRCFDEAGLLKVLGEETV